MTAQAAHQEIDVYVRKGKSHGSRTLSFQIPDGFLDEDILKLGWAIDGNSALKYVGDDKDGGPPAGDLWQAQVELMNFFHDRGYTPVYV